MANSTSLVRVNYDLKWLINGQLSDSANTGEQSTIAVDLFALFSAHVNSAIDHVLKPSIGLP